MTNSHEVIFWVLAAIQVLGVLSCLMARLGEATAAASSCRHVFVASLASVAAAMMYAFYCGSPCWATCGATFALMCVGATLDPRGKMEPSAF